MELSDSQTISTDLRSDISFMNRQRELRALYCEFKEALDAVNNISLNQTKQELSQDSSDYEEEEEYENEETNEDDIELIIQQIDLIQAETDEIFSLLSKPKFSHNKRVQKMKKQLNFLKVVNTNLKKRAELLLDKNLI